VQTFFLETKIVRFNIQIFILMFKKVHIANYMVKNFKTK